MCANGPEATPAPCIWHRRGGIGKLTLIDLGDFLLVVGGFEIAIQVEHVTRIWRMGGPSTPAQPKAETARCAWLPRKTVRTWSLGEIAIAGGEVGEACGSPRIRGLAFLCARIVKDGLGIGALEDLFAGRCVGGGCECGCGFVVNEDAASEGGFGLEAGQLRGEGSKLLLQFADLLLLVLKVGRADGAVAMLHAGKDRLDGIEIRLGDGIKLVIVAFGAAQREAKKGGAGGVHHVGKLICTLHHLQVFVLPLHAVPGAGDDEARGHILTHGVAGDLLEHEAVIGFVVVEGIDHVVAVAPGVWPLMVGFKAVAIRKAHHIQPMPRPFLAIVTGVQQLIHPLLIGLRISILFKGAHVFEGRGEASNDEMQAAQQGTAIGCGRKGEGLFTELLLDEAVDTRVCDGGYSERLKGKVLQALVFGRGLVGRVLWPDRSGVDPVLERGHLRRGERRAFGRHALVFVGGCDALKKR